jgi:pyridoxine kinase
MPCAPAEAGGPGECLYEHDRLHPQLDGPRYRGTEAFSRAAGRSGAAGAERFAHRQVAAVEAALDHYAAAISALVVDPVSGDDGRAYVAPALIAAWPRLLARADWALPNMTEVALLAGTPGDAGIEALRAAHPQLNLVVTGVTADGEVATRLVTADGARVEHRQPRLAGHVSGTGDLFAAAWVREVFVRGLAPAEALGRAAQAVAAALREGRGELALDAARG